MHAHDLRDATSDPCTEMVAIDDIRCHPQYDPSSDANDVCLLHLTASARCGASLSEQGKLPRLDRAPSLVVEGELAVVAGWGSLRTDGPYPHLLREVELPMIATSRCASRFWGRYILDGMICAGYAAGGKDSCQGDSGGPLWVSDAGGGIVQVGVVSWGGECAARNAPGVYAAVASYYDWIVSHAPEAAVPPPPPPEPPSLPALPLPPPASSPDTPLECPSHSHVPVARACTLSADQAQRRCACAYAWQDGCEHPHSVVLGCK